MARFSATNGHVCVGRGGPTWSSSTRCGLTYLAEGRIDKVGGQIVHKSVDDAESPLQLARSVAEHIKSVLRISL
ncbi:hypothetical protein CUR178_06192 [Leishmania enriettii]|uniref:Uncharacterized protein n=1 Tax=Leishmania enriettii TaxID=5663 RepID=A0A836KLN6_LEIEN|nr:hypothetical protein CUR178_06192 [Leishmania enriettii]